MATEHEEGLWLSAQARVSIVELAQCSGVSEAVLRELVEFGALTPADPFAGEWAFSADCVASVRRAARLCEDLELETPALALVLSFLERIGHLEDEVRDLSAQLAAPRRREPRA